MSRDWFAPLCIAITSEMSDHQGAGNKIHAVAVGSTFLARLMGEFPEAALYVGVSHLSSSLLGIMGVPIVVVPELGDSWVVSSSRQSISRDEIASVFGLPSELVRHP